MIIEIPERLPSWNVFYAGRNHHVRTAIKNKWHGLVANALGQYLEVPHFDGPVVIEVWAEYRGTPVDTDNICAKLIIDGLKGTVIIDDKPLYVPTVILHSEHSKRNYIVVEIREAE